MLVSGDTFVSRDTSGTCKTRRGGCGDGDLELQPDPSDGGGGGVLGFSAAPLSPPMGLPPLSPPLSPPILSSSALLLVP